MIDTVLYDGACGICSHFARWIRRIDAKNRFAIVPYQSFSELELRNAGLTIADCEKALQLITERGKVRSGASAVNYFFWHFRPWSFLVAVIYALPFLLLGEHIGYRLLARHRHTVSRMFGLDVCAVGQKRVT